VTSPTRRMWASMRAERSRLLLAGFLGFIASASAVALLGTSGWLISYAAEMPPVLALGVAAVLVRTFALTRSVFRYAERLVGHDAAFRGLTRLRESVYARLELLAPVGLARFSRGDLLARLVADVDTAMDLPLRVVLPWVQAVLVSLATVAFLLWLSPGAGVATAVALAFGLLVVPWLVARIAARAEERLAPLRGDVSSSVVASLAASADLLAFGATGSALARIRDRDAQLTAVARRESAGLGVAAGLSIAAQGAAVLAALALAIPAVSAGTLAPVWLAVVALVPLAAYDLLSGLPASALALQRVRASARRVTEVLDEPLPVAAPEHPLGPPLAPYAVSVRRVSARWDPQAPPTLRGIDLHIAPGERIAIVGPSGAGKSTLAAVLLGFLTYSGDIVLGGRQIRDLDGDDLRTVITLLTQDAHIFDTSVAANLRLGDAHADEARCERVLADVGLTGWLTGQPHGLATELGTGGVRMSGGERQRLALARLLLAQRPVMVFDEPTEHLDPQTAAALTELLIDVTVERTMILITHRLLDLDRLDRIVVLISGEIVASGTHEELLAEGGWYAERWDAERDRVDLAEITASIPAGTSVHR
jgi:thiol reductant ABC exporter CydC subunit